MSHDPVATVTIHHRPLNDIERRDLIAWFRQMAEEYEAGEHWGDAILVLQPRPPSMRSANGRRHPHP